MLPYVRVDDLTILGFHLHPFGMLVTLAIFVGTALARWRARQRGFDLQKLESFIGWMLFVGFASAHALDEILYRPHEVLHRPWSLLFFWQGIGSFSGFFGALVGIVLWRHFEARPWRTIAGLSFSKIVRRPKALPILPFADLILSVFPLAWIFGRAGCSIAHDHPGTRAGSDALLAVAYPGTTPGITDGPGPHVTLGPVTFIEGHFPRYDLGLLELLLAVGISLVCVALWRRRRATGTYAIVVSLVYAPARFLLDFLRIESTDVRYAHLTPAQWMCLGLFVIALFLVRHVLGLRRRGIDPSDEVLALAPTP